MNESFRDIVFSCFRGLGAVSYLVLIFVIFFYSFAFIAHQMFYDVQYDDDDPTDFSDFGSSCLSMAQVGDAVAVTR